MDARGLVGAWGASAALLMACGGIAGGDDESRGEGSSPTFPITDTNDSNTSQGETEGESQTSNGGSMGSADGAEGTTTASTDPTNDDSAPLFDLGGLPDAPDMTQEGCGSIDFLFVVDNSGSMSAQQTQLLASFPGFINAIQASLEGTVDSYHVGVVTSDNYIHNAPGCTTIGDLVTQTGGFGALGQVCTPFTEGYRFATEMDDLGVKFPCMAQVGTTGSGIEQPVTATIAALDPSNAGPGMCNEGFLRDDAVLVVIIVTDDPPWDPDVDDAHPTTNTSGWHDAVVAAKNGDPEAMVVIGFVPWNDVSCVFQNLESPNLIDFVSSFGAQGVLASVCEPDFGPVFASTIETIVTTCENFEPPA